MVSIANQNSLPSARPSAQCTVENGLNKKIQVKAKKTLYLYCDVHQLNLSIQHSST